MLSRGRENSFKIIKKMVDVLTKEAHNSYMDAAQRHNNKMQQVGKKLLTSWEHPNTM